jgi:DNA-binding MarR family transcriptional regulator
MNTEDLTPLEKEALELIREEGEVLQSNLWERLDCSVSKGSSIARVLEEEELVKRNRTTVNGSSTYKLTPTPQDASELDFSLLLSGDLMSPFVEDEDTRIEDERFTEWILNLKEDYQE